MPRHDTDMDLDPQIAAELAALEAALNGAPSADPTLLALVEDVRAEDPGPSLAFREDLDARVAAGFPRRSGFSLAAVPDWLWARRAITGPALGLAATVTIALVVSLGVLHDSGSSGYEADSAAPAVEQKIQTGPSAAGGASAGAAAPEAPAVAAKSAAPQASADSAASTARESAAPDRSTLSVGAAPAPAPSGGTLVGGRDRKVERTTQLALRTNARGLQKVSDGIIRVTQAAGGVVQSSSVDATDRGGTADFTLAVPAAKADDVVARLSRLAHVASMSQQTQDITAGYVNFRDLLADARAERASLLRALKKAQTADGIGRLRTRIAANRDEIARLQGQLKGIESRAATTTLAVTLTAQGGAAPVDKGESGGGTWTPRDAAHDAARVLEVGAGVLLIALAVLVPLGVITLPAWFGARQARRRRRESALDPA